MRTPVATHPRHGQALERSLTLLRVFLVASAAILLVAGLVLGAELSHALKAQALDDAKSSVVSYVDGVVGPSVVRDGRIRVAPRESSRLLAQVHRQPDLVTIKVWRADGVLAWTSRDKRRIGHRFELDGDLGETIHTGRAHGSIDHLSSDEDEVERSLGFDHRLEQSSLEAIETLNATVEAKDPYTAGHSQRVQQIALAVGEGLHLPADRLDALRYAGLFHDIGKLAVPDAILTKPSRLDPDEFEAIKRHPADGAAIVGKLGRLRPSVPLIHHHHERWDGTGYPDRLGGDAVPLEAFVVGLADAWDAMTTDRPYQRALSWDEAAEEVRRGRGTQFAPDVVDAFFAVLRRGALQRAGGDVELEQAAS